VEGAGGLRISTSTWLPPPEKRIGARVFLAHGLGEHAGRYEELARFLAVREISTVAWDHRGHGSSEGRRGVLRAFDHLLEDMERVVASVDRDGPAPPTVLLGHSLGGLVTLRYLQTRAPRIAGAILSAPWLGTVAAVPAWKEWLSLALERLAPNLTLGTGLDPALLTRDPVKRREYEEDPRVHDRISAGFHHAVVEAQGSALAGTPGPGLPLLFLVPLQDRLVDSALTLRYAQGLRGQAEVHRIPEGFHEPLNDEGRDGIFKRVGDWIESVRAPNPNPTPGYS
jgi:alpha-beta hydrolase superfamily lysophospholipase